MNIRAMAFLREGGVFLELRSVEGLGVGGEANLKWSVGVFACIWIVTCFVPPVKVLNDDIFVNAAGEKSGRFGGDLSVDGLFECVLEDSWQSA